jgi:hypothetical protein
MPGDPGEPGDLPPDRFDTASPAMRASISAAKVNFQNLSLFSVDSILVAPLLLKLAFLVGLRLRTIYRVSLSLSFAIGVEAVTESRG